MCRGYMPVGCAMLIHSHFSGTATQCEWVGWARAPVNSAWQCNVKIYLPRCKITVIHLMILLYYFETFIRKSMPYNTRFVDHVIKFLLVNICSVYDSTAVSHRRLILAALAPYFISSLPSSLFYMGKCEMNTFRSIFFLSLWYLPNLVKLPLLNRCNVGL